jgi:hypothetical protein
VSGLFSKPEPDSIRLGREHAVTAEVHYTSGSDAWWYHGNLWLTEMRQITRRAFDPYLRDPRNARVIKALAEHPNATDEEIARLAKLPPPPPGEVSTANAWIVREVRRSLARADQTHTLRVYGLSGAYKDDERILVSIDQDLVKEAPMISYSKTEKGAKRTQLWMMGSMLVFYVIFLVATFQFLQSAQTLAYNPGAATSLLSGWATPLAFLMVVVGMQMYWSRRMKVLDLQLQPLVENLNDTHTEAVYLVNSEKAPVTAYIAQVLGLPDSSVREIAEAIGEFPADMISSLQSQNRSYRRQLDHSKVLGIEATMQEADAASLGLRRRGIADGWSATTIVIVCAIIAVVAVVGTYAAVTGA